MKGSTVRDDTAGAVSEPATSRFNLVVSDDLLEKLRGEATRRRIPVAAVIDELLRLGLRVKSVLETPGGGVWIREREQGELERVWIPHS